jgi:hypothetical protein
MYSVAYQEAEKGMYWFWKLVSVLEGKQAFWKLDEADTAPLGLQHEVVHLVVSILDNVQ